MSTQNEASAGVAASDSPKAVVAGKTRFQLGAIVLIVVLFVIGTVIGGTLLWPVGEQVRLFSCLPNLMAQSPICRGYSQDDVFASSVGNHVSMAGGWIGSAIGAALGLVLACVCLAVGRNVGTES
jgi:hypothetical protein